VKVIFLEDVPNVARAGEAREVADGYGRNFLLPRKLAVLANSQASGVVEAQLKKIAWQRAQTEAEMAELAGKLDGVEVTVKARAGARDRLYGSITSADIADELNSSTGLVIDKRKIELEEPIRQLGSYDVSVRFTHDIAAIIKLTVVADKVVEEKEEKKVEAEKKRGKKVKETVEKVEEAGKKRGKKVKETVEKVEEAGKKRGKKAEETVEKVEEAGKKRGKKVKETVEKVEEAGKKRGKKAEETVEKVEEVEEKEVE
jgi:large subunit ribosomal protein L9